MVDSNDVSLSTLALAINPGQGLSPLQERGAPPGDTFCIDREVSTLFSVSLRGVCIVAARDNEREKKERTNPRSMIGIGNQLGQNGVLPLVRRT